jgi:hypothetical protein
MTPMRSPTLQVHKDLKGGAKVFHEKNGFVKRENLIT